jgi:HJR/Mrr/RecB family endonuclease
MNRKVIFNIISEINLLTVIQCSVIIYNVYNFANKPYYIFVTQTIKFVPDICNALILYRSVNLVVIKKRRYSHLNKRLSNCINRQSVGQ